VVHTTLMHWVHETQTRNTLFLFHSFIPVNLLLAQATISIISNGLQRCWKYLEPNIWSDCTRCGDLAIGGWSHWSVGGPRFIENLVLDRERLFLWKAGEMDWSCCDSDQGIFSPGDVLSSPSSEDSSDLLSYGRVRPLDLRRLVVEHS